ncbi:hypothetical protein PQX77_001773 [Marasmius sp. AFHP31]|nr:hypothetical protein PQX77_001773 [Marasmius sp. AFHP31]
MVKEVPGPVHEAAWLIGNLADLLLSENYGDHEYQWQQQYGSIYRLKGCFSEDILFTSDPSVFRYVMNNDQKLFGYTSSRHFIVLMLLGPQSLITVPSRHDHRRIKNAFAPAFTNSRLQLYIPIIQNITRKAVEKLTEQCSVTGKRDRKSAIDMYDLLQYITSDVIGEVGFGHKFNAVETNGGDEIARSHKNIVALGWKPSEGAVLADSLLAYLPRVFQNVLIHVPTGAFKTLSHFRTISEKWSVDLLRTNMKMHEASQGQERDTGLMTSVGMRIVLLSKLFTSDLHGTATMQDSMKERERLTFEEIAHQTATMLVSGQDTTGNTLAWALFEFAKRPEWQEKVRQEIIKADATGTAPNSDKLDYLNAHIKETLRWYPSAPYADRVAYEDTVLPLSQPLTTTSGRVITQLPIRKGQTIYLGLGSFNRNPDIWGPDANVFDPSRWIQCNGRSEVKIAGGSFSPYANLSSFGGGVRVCLGLTSNVFFGSWRLAILELQIVLAELISKFRFSFEPGDESFIQSALAVTILPRDSQTGRPSLPLKAEMVDVE